MQKKKRVPKSRIPKSILGSQIFKPMYDLLKDIEQGEIHTVDGDVVFKKWKAFYVQGSDLISVRESITIWCDTWGIVAHMIKEPYLETRFLRKIGVHINFDEEDCDIYESDIKGAKLELDKMFELWKKVDTETLAKASAMATQNLTRFTQNA